MPSSRTFAALLLSLLLPAPALAQEQATSAIVLSDSASVVELTSGQSLFVTFVLTPSTEAGIRFEASDSLLVQNITHPKSDVAIVDGQLEVRCRGLGSHPVRQSEPVRIHSAALLNRTKVDPAMNTLVFHNSNADTVWLRYEPYGQTKRLMVVDVTQSE